MALHRVSELIADSALAFSQAGWVLGIALLICFSALTNYTAKILARVLADDMCLMTYADIGAKAFGQTARNFINALFCLEISALWYALYPCELLCSSMQPLVSP